MSDKNCFCSCLSGLFEDSDNIFYIYTIYYLQIIIIKILLLINGMNLYVKI